MRPATPFLLTTLLLLAACGDTLLDGAGAAGEGPFFVLEAGSGSLGGAGSELRIELDSVAQNVVTFADRPVREAGSISLRDFAGTWRAEGLDERPPTASLTARGEDGRARVLRLFLHDPQVDGDSIGFRATPLDDSDDFPQRFTDADLFIDSVGSTTGDWTAESFVLDAGAGTAEPASGGRLLITVDAPLSTVVLSGAPMHGVGSISTEELVSEWATHFAGDSPNASLTVRGDDDVAHVAVVVLSNPAYAADGTLSFDAEPIAGATELPASFASSDFFIDSAFSGLQGIDYAPGHYDVASKNFAVPWADIDSDFQLMASHFNAVRLYQLDQYNVPRVLRAAERYGLNVALSVAWANGNDSYNQQQLASFQFLMSTYPELMKIIPIVIVGNEACVDDSGSPAAWNAFYDQVASWVNANWQGPKPIVTMSERWSVWLGGSGTCGQKLRDHLPKNTPIFANIYPFWGDCTLAQAIGTETASCPSFQAMWNQINSGIQDHPIIIGETGWPTAGQAATNPKTVAPTLADSQSYWQYVYSTFKTENPGASLFAFSAFDEPLKPAEGGSDLAQHWGFYDSNRGGKITSFPLTKPVSPVAAHGTFVNIVPTGSLYTPSLEPQITVTSGPHTYSYQQWHVATGTPGGYPWFDYETDVSINLPAAGSFQATSCRNAVASGHGLVDQNLVWKNPNGGTPPCNQINWHTSGVYLP